VCAGWPHSEAIREEIQHSAGSKVRCTHLPALHAQPQEQEALQEAFVGKERNKKKRILQYPRLSPFFYSAANKPTCSLDPCSLGVTLFALGLRLFLIQLKIIK
jgi:hypothetical protein